MAANGNGLRLHCDDPLMQHFANMTRRRCMAVMHASSREALPVLGTGTAIRSSGSVFVATCAHVARPFFEDALGWLVFDGMPEVQRSECELVHIDDERDVALFRMRPRAAATLKNILPVESADFSPEAGYRALRAGTPRLLAVAGLPASLTLTSTEQRVVVLHPLVVTTVVRRRRRDRLELDYAHVRIGDRVVAPPGMSGALVYECHEPRSGELWMPGRVVAMLHAWSEVGTKLVCSPVHELRNLLPT